MSVSSNTKRRVKLASMLAIAFIANGAGLAAAGDLRVEPQCPSSITPGGTLIIELKLTNTDKTITYISNGQPFTYQTGDPVIIAKSGVLAHIGNLNVLGPFVIPLSETIQPQQPVTIDFSKPTPPSDPANDVSITTNGYLNVAFPTNATKGTFTNMLIYVLDEKNNTLGGGECVIEVR